MAEKRMISGNFWDDEFTTSLSFFDRLIWLGIISACADDQGRLRDSAAWIRSRIFPEDDIQLKPIKDALEIFANDGKIERYESGGKNIIQIINWWKHQNPRWASPSLFNPPEGWVDRVRYHAAENKIITENWNTKGGYIADYKAGYTMPYDDVKDDVKDDDEVKDDGDVDVELCNDDNNEQKTKNDNDNPEKELEKAFYSATHIQINNGGSVKASQAYREMLKAGVLPEDIPIAVAEMAEKSYTIAGPWSIVKPAMNVMARRASKRNKSPAVDDHKRYITGEFGNVGVY